MRTGERKSEEIDKKNNKWKKEREERYKRRRSDIRKKTKRSSKIKIHGREKRWEGEVCGNVHTHTRKRIGSEERDLKL